MVTSVIKGAIESSIETKTRLLEDERSLEKIAELSSKCTDSLRAGGKVIFCGNGGSFADAQHLSAEFTSRFLFDRPGLASLALGTNSSSITAIGNDYGYEQVFSREIEALAVPGDVIIALTTSGNSKNILMAIEAAHRKNVSVTVLTGEGRGKLPCDVSTINVPSTNTARIQESHILIGHIVCEIVEEEIFGSMKA